jgi:small nuclear ribonucleoprotein (snRNP)-like protein
MVAYVAAFDKHWNMALTDIEETFLRKIRRKIPIHMGESVKISEEELEKRGLVRPKVIKKVGNKFELCKRYIPQLMIRGEQIVIVYPVV